MQQEQHGPCAEIIVYSHSQLKNDAQLTPIVGCYRDAAARMNHRQIQPLCKICYTVCFIGRVVEALCLKIKDGDRFSGRWILIDRGECIVS